MSPENAEGQTGRIWGAIKSLEQLPESHQDRLVGQFAGKGYNEKYNDLLDDHTSYEVWSFFMHFFRFCLDFPQ